MIAAVGSVSAKGAISGVRLCGRCGCRLSAYNSDELCAACARVAGGPPPDEPPPIPARVWADPEVQAALAAFDFGRVSKLIRQRGSIRQEDLARLTGLSQGFLSMLESGARRLTSIDRIIDFVDGLAVPAELVRLPRRRAADFRPVVESPRGEWNKPASFPGAVAEAGTARPPADLGPGGGERAMPQRLSDVRGRRPTPAVSSELLDHLSATTESLRRMDAVSGSGGLTEPGFVHLALVVGLLKRGNDEEAIRQRLAAVAADTANTTGWINFDSGRYAAAHRMWTAALRAADSARDPRLGAGALSCLAMHAYSTGRTREAVEAATSAREKIKHLDAPALRAMLFTREARAYAKLGDRRACLHALDRATDSSAHERAGDDPPWLYWMNEGEIHRQAGACHLELGDSRRAVDRLGLADYLLDPQHKRTRATVLLLRTTAHLSLGEWGAARRAYERALSLARDVQSARLEHHIRDVGTSLAGTGGRPATRALTDRGTKRAGCA